MSAPAKAERPAATGPRATGAGAGARRRWSPRRVKEAAWAAVFLAPAIVAIATMRIAPTVDALWASFHRGFPGGLRPEVWDGFGQFEALFGDPAFRQTIVRTIVFNVIINPVQIAISLFLAVAMTRRIALRGLWRMLLFVPVTIPIVGSSIVWGIALLPQGPVNAVIEALGGSAQPFFTSPSQAMAGIILVSSWIGVGYWMIFLISGIEAIPPEYYEAAKLDRAGPLRTFFSITMPLLKRPLLFVLVADTVANFVLFVPVQVLTDGGPQDSTNMLMYNAYRTSFTYGSKNLGAAQVTILTVIMLVFVVLQFRLLREDKEAEQ
jgi:multiple sugar transport system permease protein